MMKYDVSNYVSHPVDAAGNAAYTQEDNAVWQTLYDRQTTIVKNRGCDEYLAGLRALNLPTDRVPQCHEVSEALARTSGWTLQPVPALIPFEEFFWLLANKKFPAATFIRRMADLDYIKEPDIFHEIFGHCPLITLPRYAAFMQHYGELGLAANKKERVLLARLFWFTVEFGLIHTQAGLRAYGGGILSSISETVYALESNAPQRVPFDLMKCLTTPYRIDVIQPIYFVLENFEQMYELVEMDLMAAVRRAQSLDMSGPESAC
jgi:phenylalanine-4-hydroxylase